MKGISRPLTAVFIVIAVALFTAPAFAADEGAPLFAKFCVPCHGANGTGDTPMGKKVGAKPLGAALQGKSDDEVKTVITKGKGKMPGFTARLTPEQVTAVVAYIRSLKK